MMKNLVIYYIKCILFIPLLQNLEASDHILILILFSQVLNVLQSCAMAYNGVVNEDNVYSCVGHPLKSDIRDIVTWMLNEPFSVAYNNIMNVKTLKGKGQSKNGEIPMQGEFQTCCDFDTKFRVYVSMVTMRTSAPEAPTLFKSRLESARFLLEFLSKKARFSSSCLSESLIQLTQF